MIPFSSRRFCLLLLSVCLLPLSPVLSAEPQTPKPGSPERKAIADALRVPVKAELKKDVIFKVNHLKVLNGWAFLAGVPLKPDGSEMDYRGTVHEESFNLGIFDDGIFALLQKRDGQWLTMRYAIGATDVPYFHWQQELGAPAVIFEP